MMVEGKNPTVAPYCQAGEVRLRVTAKAHDEKAALAMCDETVARIQTSGVGPHIYAVTDARDGAYSLERAVIAALQKSNQTVATAESCTGGLIAKRLTDIPGSSAVVKGGFVTYTNEMKMALLGVSGETLTRHTELSEETAREMARGARIKTGADIAVSTTGLAGPGGGSDGCPIGTVFLGISTKKGEESLRLTLSPDRSRDYIRTLAASHALFQIWKRLC